MIADSDKIVLVRPQGGLNDTLVQIEKCCSYAEISGRKVIVDTAYAGSYTFHDALSNYFDSRQRGLILDASKFEVSKARDVFPNHLSGRLGDYRTFYKNDCCVDLIKGEPITFDFKKNYTERVVVHHQFGGGDSSSFFQRVFLKPELQKRLSERLARLAPSYVGVHIRNTDYQSDFRKLIDEMVANGLFKNRRVFFATDSEEALHYIKTHVTDALHVEFTQADLQGNQPLHRRPTNDQIYWKESNSEAILDLLTLAYSNKIFTPPIQNTIHSTDAIPSNLKFSGFVRLAIQLQSQRALLTQFAGVGGWLDL